MIRKGFLLQIIFMYLFAGNMFAQIKIEGKIVDKTDKPLPFVNVYWKGTTIGTTSLDNGHFTISKTEKSDTLIFSFIGYQTKYVFANRNNIGTVKLKDDMMSIEEVVVTSRRKAEEISKLTPRKTEKLTSASLERLPCCHLAATFENTLSVDKTYTDAVTGTEEIKMLGLAGVYTQILSEEVPVARGLSASLGLHVPGPYLKSVSISKGIGSVISGYEGITGQVQMFLKQPDNSENFFANLYMNSFLSTDINLYKGFEISDKWNSMLFVHGSLHSGEIDNNNDGFLDMPTGKAGNITQTFKYDNKGKYRHQFGYRLTYKDDYGGESEFDKNRDRGTTNFYGVGIINKRYELFSNQMFRIKWLKDVTFGVKTNYAYAENSSFFGLKDYTGKEDNINSTLNIEKRWNKYGQKLSFGGSFMYDSYNQIFNRTNINREEVVPGIHVEYTVQPIKQITLIGGIRADFHNIYGTMYTPRFNLKYNITNKSVIRLLAGKGYRVANPILDNLGLLASSRSWILPESNNNLLEEAWSFGGSISHSLTMFGKKLAIEFDYHRTEFNSKIITDLLSDPDNVLFYALDGRSFADNYQASVSFDPFKRLQIKIAGRYNNIKETYNGKLQDKLYNAKFKGLLTLSYATKYSRWQFDITNQFIGKSKLSHLEDAEYSDYSPAFYQIHAQVTRRFKHLDVYLAGENLTNYTQKNPIISSNDPFSKSFDATRVWGPIMGTKISFGLRFKIK